MRGKRADERLNKDARGERLRAIVKAGGHEDKEVHEKEGSGKYRTVYKTRKRNWRSCDCVCT